MAAAIMTALAFADIAVTIPPRMNSKPPAIAKITNEGGVEVWLRVVVTR